MRLLDPNDAGDSRITAYTISWTGKELPFNTIELWTQSYDCWDRKQPGPVVTTTTPAYAAAHSGLKVHVTLRMIEMGCCPPWLMSEVQGIMEFGW